MIKKFMISGFLINLLLLNGCGNKDLFDTNYTFSKAIIVIGEKSIDVDVKQWRDYEDGDQIQITAKDGTVYLTHASNVLLVK